MTIAYVTLFSGNKVHRSCTIEYQARRTSNQIDNRHINVDYTRPRFFNIPERVSVIELEWRASGAQAMVTKRESAYSAELQRGYDTFMRGHTYIYIYAVNRFTQTHKLLFIMLVN